MRTIDEWTGAYPSNWRGVVVPEAMVHPAKFSSRLIRKIYQHMIDEGWVKSGDHILDPFGGVALGALDAMRLGLNWHGVELEVKFQKIGQDNISFWNKRFGQMPGWGTAEILQGDSRFLLKVLRGEIQCAVSSEGQLGAMSADGFDAAIASPPFLQTEGGTAHVPSKYAHDKNLLARHAAGNAAANGYGESEGQLSSMKAGGFSAALSSPPFQGSTADGGYQLLGKYAEEGKLTVKQVKGKKNKAYPSWNKDRDTEYAPSPENLGNLEKGDLQAAISSPPYEATQLSGGGGIANEMRNTYREGQNYGDSDGQLGATAGDDFWMASRQIVEQVYLALAPGGHACWVLKDYVKNKAIVPFCDQWRQLCEAVGFVTIHEHHAMLVRHNGTQHKLEGGSVTKTVSSKSFFRRVAESHGSPEINFEVILCMVKEAK